VLATSPVIGAAGDLRLDDSRTRRERLFAAMLSARKAFEDRLQALENARHPGDSG
jgi:hypothetical protein